jgi:thiamine pyrophosphokinase
MPQPRAVIFVNGELCNIDAFRSLLQPDDYLVAADGGVYHLLRLNLLPKVLIGDLDSVEPEDVAALERKGVRVVRFPVEKNETDLELALLLVLREGYRQIRVAAGLGGRLDQTLGNLFLLSRHDLDGCDIRLEDGCEEVILINERAELVGCAGDRVSLLPLGGRVVGVTTEGLKYGLAEETLWSDRTRGISNEMTGERAVVVIRRGQLLCIHTRQEPKKEE